MSEEESGEAVSGHDDIYDVVIIGGGPGGMSAAIYAARSGLSTLVVDKNPFAGALGKARWIENYPGVEGTIEGQELLGIMRKQAEGFGAKIEEGQVAGADLKSDPKQVFTNTKTFMARSVIIATGSMGRKASIPGEADLIGRGVSYCATCDAPFFKNKVVAMVGDIKALINELDEVARFAKSVYVVARNDELAKEHRALLKENPKVKIFTSSRLAEVVGEDAVSGIKILDSSEKTQTLSVDGVFLYLTGAKPITDFLLGAVELDEKGCIKTNSEDKSTSLPGVYAIGDVTCKQIRQVVVATAEGCIAALSADKYIHDRKRVRTQWGG